MGVCKDNRASVFMPQLSKEREEVLRMLKLILAERPELEREITCDMASWLEMLKRALEAASQGKMDLKVVIQES